MKRSPKPPPWELLEGRDVLYFRPEPYAGLKVGRVKRWHPRRQEARVRPLREPGSELVPLASIRSVLWRRREVSPPAFLVEELARRGIREAARKVSSPKARPAEEEGRPEPERYPDEDPKP